MSADYPSDEEGEESVQAAQDALLEQMRALRTSLEREDGVLQQRAADTQRERATAQKALGMTVASIINEVASAPSVLDVLGSTRIDKSSASSSASAASGGGIGFSCGRGGEDGSGGSSSYGCGGGDGCCGGGGDRTATAAGCTISHVGSADGGEDFSFLSGEHQLGAAAPLVSSSMALPSPPTGPSPPPARPAQAAKASGKPPRFAAKGAGGAGSRDAARDAHLAKVRGAPSATTGGAADIARLASKPLLPPEPAPARSGKSLRGALS